MNKKLNVTFITPAVLIKRNPVYQIQPAVLTPFPGTPVYDQFKSEGRMMADYWYLFDMVNVTFQPKQLSPWELQYEMWRAVDEFYDFPSALRIGKLFGAEYGWRRFHLAFWTSICPPGTTFLANHAKWTPYYTLKHTPWMFAPPGDPRGEAAAEATDEKRKRHAAHIPRTARIGIALGVAVLDIVLAEVIKRHPGVAASTIGSVT